LRIELPLRRDEQTQCFEVRTPATARHKNCRSSRAGRSDAVYLRAAQAYMLISMPTGTSTILGVFQVIPSSQEVWRGLHAEVEPRTTPAIAQVRKSKRRSSAGCRTQASVPTFAQSQCCRSAREYQALGAQTFLPMMALEFGIPVLLHGPANTEIGNKRPAVGHLKYPTQDLRLEDRNPA
jgi:hypothetical protein